MIELVDWKQRGLAGHFICANKCLFRLCTDIGRYRISTVGAYYPEEDSKTMMTIGINRHYETFVFEIDDSGKIKNHCEIDSDGLFKPKNENPYETDKKAEQMHKRMCIKYAELQ